MQVLIANMKRAFGHVDKDLVKKTSIKPCQQYSAMVWNPQLKRIWTYLKDFKEQPQDEHLKEIWSMKRK